MYDSFRHAIGWYVSFISNILLHVTSLQYGCGQDAASIGVTSSLLGSEAEEL
jgi:hypothetical protein